MDVGVAHDLSPFSHLYLDALAERFGGIGDRSKAQGFQALRDLGRTSEAEAEFRRAAPLMSDGWRADLMLGVMYSERMDRKADANSAGADPPRDDVWFGYVDNRPHR